MVPLSLEVVGANVTSLPLHSPVRLQCVAMSFPRATVSWSRGPPTPRTLPSAETLLDHVRVLSTIAIESLSRHHNGTYTCTASTPRHHRMMAQQDVVVLEPAEISVDSVEALDSRTALLRWSLEYKGNLPVKRYHLQMKNYSTGPAGDWLDMDDKIPANATSYTVRYLAPAVTYGFQLAAVNEAGHSNWEAKNLTMPADVPPKITWVQMMASTNETLLFGWRRPPHDNGADISHYVVQLSKQQRPVSNETLPVQMPSERQNYIFIFVGLEPGECYAFQVQACSQIGCGSWSDELDATTSDGMADPPENVKMQCFHDNTQNINYAVVTWDAPKNIRGSVQSYNVTLEGETRYRNATGSIVSESFLEHSEVRKENHVFKSTVRPNTRYAVRVCTRNRAGCGHPSAPSDKAHCDSPPSVPSSMPEFELNSMEGHEKCRQLKLKLQPVSERNGFIRCYRVIVIKLGEGDSISILPRNPDSVNLTSYEGVHQTGKGAYLAEAFDNDNLASEVVLGDGEFSLCDPRTTGPPFRLRKSAEEEGDLEDEERTLRVYDGSLDPDTNYSGFVEVQVWGPDGQILAKQSEYFKPVQTSSLSSSGTSAGTAPPVRPTDSPMTFLFGVICGTVLVVLVLIFVICLIRRRNSCPYEGDEGEHLGLTALLRRTVHRSTHLARGSHLSKLPYFGPIAAEELATVYAERHLDTDLLFRSEFEALPDVFRDRTTTASDSIDNACKNRYPEIKAYDQTRIRLSSDMDIPGSDYINANFVEGYREKKLYICAQAPLRNTVCDFWRMVWQQGVSVIVMLTGLEENGADKCAQYWSDSKTLDVGYFSVTLVGFKKCSDYILRTLLLKCSKVSIHLC
ncbi:hypothetical protein JTE90_002547 [Oedothorax gibbosus]|uniref:Uncharacterized protein n=1 Tax=Oedothorax gibbosus TaxID=931172 RepID=A0AAV6V3U4_9ARAC|nr:hypothetical protein JTE90_002547 [Oedothorax gibbosus]